MRFAPILFLISLPFIYSIEDENSEDVFDMRRLDDGASGDDINEGSETFETSTEMIEPQNETFISKTAVFSPVTPMDTELLSSFKTTEAPTVETITFESTPIVADEVANRRVLKEKEIVIQTTTVSTSAPFGTDMSETDEDASVPFDQSALDGIFESDGSVIDKSIVDSAPAFPILKMSEEDSKFISNGNQHTTVTEEVVSTTEAVPSSSSSSTTTTASSTTSEAEKPAEMSTMAAMKMAQEEETTTEQPTTLEITTESTTTTAMIVEESEATSTNAPTTESFVVSSSESSDETTASEELTTFSEVSQSHHLANSSKVFSPEKIVRTSFSVRIVSIDFMDEFSDLKSGPSKRLAKDIIPSILSFANMIYGGHTILDIEFKSLKKGSVIVDGDFLSIRALNNPQESADKFEMFLSNNNSMLGNYKADSLSVSIDGMKSRAYLNSLSPQGENEGDKQVLSSNVMIIIIALSLIAIVFLIVCCVSILYTNCSKIFSRREKLDLESVDNNSTSSDRSTLKHPPNVHLMSYGNSNALSPTPSQMVKRRIDETTAY